MNTSTHRGSNRRTAAKNINSVNELLAAYVKHNDFTMATMKDIMNGTALSEEQYQTLFKANNIGLPAMSQVVLNFVQQMSIMQMQTPQGNFAQILASLAALTNHAEPVKELASPEKKDMFLIDNILVDHLELEDEISMMKSSCKQLQVGNEQTAINNNNTKKLKRKIRTSIEKSATEKEKDVPPIVLDPVNPATEHVVLRSKKSTADCSQGSQSPYSEPVAKSTRSELEAYDIDTIFMALINEKPGDSHKSTKDIVSEYDSGVSQNDQLELAETMVGEREGEVSTRKSKRHKSTKNGYRREVFDVGKAVRKIDKACKKAENKRRSVDSDESISADTSSETSESSLGAPIFSTPVETSSDAPSDVVMQLKRTRRRKVSESVTSPIEPKRRSARIKDICARHDDVFFKQAVEANRHEHDEHDDLDVPYEPDEPVVKPTRAKPVRVSKPRVPVGRRDRACAPTRPKVLKDEGAILKKGDGIPISDIIKRRKFYSRVDYNRHYFDNLSEKILNKVLTPADQGDCQILTHFTYPVIRRAIVNKSTLCYAISMLQVMTRVPQIYSIIRSHNHKGTQKAKCFLCLLADTFAAKPSLDDFSTFINIIKEIWPTVDVDMMHCVMEAMQHFFDKFDMEFSRQHSKYVYDHNEDFSLTRSFFEIEMVNEFKCTVCDHVFGVKDKAVYLSIDLSRKSNGTMQGYLDNFSLPTAACGIECTYCKADKFTCTTHFSKLPEVLLYFIPRVRTRRNDKDMTVVEVQKEIVVRTKTEEQQYALCAFVTHHGDNGRKGHYKMFEVDNQHPDKPYNEFDDAKVIHDALLTWDMTVVLAMFRKIDAVAKDAPTDIIFDGRGNVVYANEKYVAEANADYRRYQ